MAPSVSYSALSLLQLSDGGKNLRDLLLLHLHGSGMSSVYAQAENGGSGLG